MKGAVYYLTLLCEPVEHWIVLCEDEGERWMNMEQRWNNKDNVKS
jgi:hypothetical protein